MGGTTRQLVIAGLDAAILRSRGIFRRPTDARIEPAHDQLETGVTP